MAGYWWRRLTMAGVVWSLLAGTAHAVPALQVGAPGAPGEGVYADYGSGPGEDDTAFTSGASIFVAGTFRNPNVVGLGGAHEGGADWSSFGVPDAFDGHGAILLVSVADGSLETAFDALRINGQSAFYGSANESYFGNRHDPLKDEVSDFLFFDIGDFALEQMVPDFVSEKSGNKMGAVMELLVSGYGDINWLHFDVLALETSRQGKHGFRTSIVSNPASHDVRMTPPDETVTVAEPATVSLLLGGLAGAWLALRCRRKLSSAALPEGVTQFPVEP